MMPLRSRQCAWLCLKPKLPSLRSQLVEVQKEQNGLMVQAYRDGMNTPHVSAARRALFEQASIEHAKNIVGSIEGAEDHTEPQQKPRVTWQGGKIVKDERGN